MSTPLLTELDVTNGSIINVPNPTNPGDAANKAYVDLTAQGLLPKQSFEWATAAPLPNTPSYNNGAGTLTAGANAAISVDGGNPVMGDRVLVKNQASAFQNGIYQVTTVGSGGAPWVLTRASDGLTSAELVGAYGYVEQGTVNVGTTWVNTNSVQAGTAPIVIGTTSINWGLLSGPNSFTGTAPIVVTGTVISLSTVPVASGGTAQTTAANARGTSGIGAPAVAPTGAWSPSAVGIPTKVIFTIGDGATTAFTLTHNLGTTAVHVMVVPHGGGGNQVIVDIDPATTNTVVVTFAAAPGVNAYDVVVIG